MDDIYAFGFQIVHNYWVDMVKIGHGFLVHETLKSGVSQE